MGLFNGGIFDKINKGLTKAWDVNVQGTKLVGSALFPGAGNYLSQMETNAANRKLQEQANRQNTLLWNQQTAYNDPAAQMTRLKAAGLNPQLAYGQIADSKASSPPQMQAARNEAPRFSSSLDNLAAFQQIMNMQSMNAKTQTDNLLAAEDLKQKKWENALIRNTGTIRSDSPMYRMFLRLLSNPIGRQIITDWNDAPTEPPKFQLREKDKK